MSNEQKIRDYTIIEKLGTGSYGVVYKVRSDKDQKIYVIKEISLYGLGQKQISDVKLEAKILSSIKSDYVVRYYDSFEDNNKLMIVMEYCDGGDLDKFITSQKQTKHYLKEDLIWRIFIKIAIGLGHIHKLKILHRDLKTLNIFLMKDLQVKIGDLGVAKVLTQTSFAKTFIGTPYYLSPEICEEQPYNDKSDVWALGCILYELCTYTHPFNAKSQGALILKILKAEYEPIKTFYSNDLQDLVKFILIKDCKIRPSVIDILKKNYVQNKAKQLGVYKDLAELCNEVPESPIIKIGEEFNKNKNLKQFAKPVIKKEHNRPSTALNKINNIKNKNRQQPMNNKIHLYEIKFNNINNLGNKHKENKEQDLGYINMPMRPIASNKKKVINKKIKIVPNKKEKKKDEISSKNAYMNKCREDANLLIKQFEENNKKYILESKMKKSPKRIAVSVDKNNYDPLAIISDTKDLNKLLSDSSKINGETQLKEFTNSLNGYVPKYKNSAGKIESKIENKIDNKSDIKTNRALNIFESKNLNEEQKITSFNGLLNDFSGTKSNPNQTKKTKNNEVIAAQRQSINVKEEWTSKYDNSNLEINQKANNLDSTKNKISKANELKMTNHQNSINNEFKIINNISEGNRPQTACNQRSISSGEEDNDFYDSVDDANSDELENVREINVEEEKKIAPSDTEKEKENVKLKNDIKFLNDKVIKLKDDLLKFIGQNDYKHIMSYYDNIMNDKNVDFDIAYSKIENFAKEKYKNKPEEQETFNNYYLQLISNEAQLNMLKEKQTK